MFVVSWANEGDLLSINGRFDKESLVDRKVLQYKNDPSDEPPKLLSFLRSCRPLQPSLAPPFEQLNVVDELKGRLRLREVTVNRPALTSCSNGNLATLQEGAWVWRRSSAADRRY